MWWIVVEDSKHYVMVNGNRARSRNNDYPFGAVTGAETDPENPDHVKIMFEAGVVTSAKFHQLDLIRACEVLKCRLEELRNADAAVDIINNMVRTDSSMSLFGDSISTCTPMHAVSLDDTDSQPILSNITNSNKRRRNSTAGAKSKKRTVIIDEDDASIDMKITGKCRGIFEVPLRYLREPKTDLQRRRNHHEIQQAKSQLISATNIKERHIIPALSREVYVQGMELEVLGSCLSSFILAAKELAEDERFKSLEQGWRVKVYERLDHMQALRVGNTYQKGQIVTTTATFADQAAMCRSILFRDNSMEVEEEEPPTMRGPTRKQCALALGRSTERKALRALEPTFQLASYSRRCYMKAQEVFSNYQEKTGKHLTQFWFMKLQGLPEETRYRLLVEVASDLNLKRMGEDAEETKKKQHIKDIFMKAVGSASWDQTCERFPKYTTEDAMKPYLGLKFKKGSMPTSFLSFVQNAKTNLPCDNQAALSVNDISETKNETRDVLYSPPARTSVYLFKNLQSAGAPLRLGRGDKKSLLHVVNSSADDITGNKVQATVEYAVICGPSALRETIVLMDQQEVFQFLIENFSSEGEVVLDNTQSNGAVAREACELGRRGEQHTCERLNDDDNDDDETEVDEDSILIPAHSTPLDHSVGPYSFDENSGSG